MYKTTEIRWMQEYMIWKWACRYKIIILHTRTSVAIEIKHQPFLGESNSRGRRERHVLFVYSYFLFILISVYSSFFPILISCLFLFLVNSYFCLFLFLVYSYILSILISCLFLFLSILSLPWVGQPLF